MWKERPKPPNKAEISRAGVPPARTRIKTSNMRNCHPERSPTASKASRRAQSKDPYCLYALPHQCILKKN